MLLVPKNEVFYVLASVYSSVGRPAGHTIQRSGMKFWGYVFYVHRDRFVSILASQNNNNKKIFYLWINIKNWVLLANNSYNFA